MACPTELSLAMHTDESLPHAVLGRHVVDAHLAFLRDLADVESLRPTWHGG